MLTVTNTVSDPVLPALSITTSTLVMNSVTGIIFTASIGDTFYL